MGEIILDTRQPSPPTQIDAKMALYGSRILKLEKKLDKMSHEMLRLRQQITGKVLQDGVGLAGTGQLCYSEREAEVEGSSPSGE